MTIGHVLKNMFLLQGGRIRCQVTASRCYSGDLPQGELEIPCMLMFEGGTKDIAKSWQASEICTFLEERTSAPHWQTGWKLTVPLLKAVPKDQAALNLYFETAVESHLHFAFKKNDV